MEQRTSPNRLSKFQTMGRRRHPSIQTTQHEHPATPEWISRIYQHIQEILPVIHNSLTPQSSSLESQTTIMTRTLKIGIYKVQCKHSPGKFTYKECNIIYLTREQIRHRSCNSVGSSSPNKQIQKRILKILWQTWWVPKYISQPQKGPDSVLCYKISKYSGNPPPQRLILQPLPQVSHLRDAKKTLSQHLDPAYHTNPIVTSLHI